MPPSERIPRVTEHGAVELPPSLTVADAERLARRLRPSWDETFDGSLPRDLDEPRPSRSAVGGRPSASPGARGAGASRAPSFDDDSPDRSRRSRAARATPDHDAGEWDHAAGAGLPRVNPQKLRLGIGIGVAALAIVALAAWAFTGEDTKSTPAGVVPPTVVPAASTGAATSAPKEAVSARPTAEPDPARPAGEPEEDDAAADAKPLTKPSKAVAKEPRFTFDDVAPKKDSTALKSKAKTKSGKASDKPKEEEAPAPPAPKPNEGGTIVRDTPF